MVVFQMIDTPDLLESLYASKGKSLTLMASHKDSQPFKMDSQLTLASILRYAITDH
ncbi:hypothetical protein ACXHP7_20215 [Vibrio chemaguriensis]